MTSASAASVSPTWVPELGEIIWLNFTPQAGKEMAGCHPFLVLSSREFNAKTKTVMGLAMTSQHHGDPKAKGFNPFQLENLNAKGQKSYINSNQVSTFDWEARGARPHPWGKVNGIVLKNAKEYLNAILALS
jgi:mRNA interferase MazF